MTTLAGDQIAAVRSGYESLALDLDNRAKRVAPDGPTAYAAILGRIVAFLDYQPGALDALSRSVRSALRLAAELRLRSRMAPKDLRLRMLADRAVVLLVQTYELEGR